MVHALEPLGMAKVKEPTATEGEGGETRQIRVFADLADMLGEIIDVKKMRGEKGASVAVFVDEVLRPFVHQEYERLKGFIEQMRRIREAAQEAAKKKSRKG